MTEISKQITKVLSNIDIRELKPIQSATIDAYAKSKNIVLLSPTGSGKTLAFLLPLLNRLTSAKGEVQAMIIAPSRELAQQIERVFRSLGSGYKVVCCYGGHSIKIESDQLLEAPTVLIATPGRVLDHILRGRINGSTVKTLILDEFDKCLEMGFTEEMAAIIAALPNIDKRILTSATNAEIPEYTGIANPLVLDYLENSIPSGSLTIMQVRSYDNDKLETLYRVLCETGKGQKIVFCNYRESVDRISDYLFKMGIPNSVFHGGMEQSERERSLVKFRNGSTDVIVSTDLAARGLDVPDIKQIIHYHLPLSEESYIHRNGRTARMGAEGRALLIVGPDEFLPEYVDEKIPYFTLSENTPPVAPCEWVTLYIGKGKRDKLSKIDIVGFLIKQGGVEKVDIGSIELKELYAYVAIRSTVANELLRKIRGLKIKKMKTKFELSL